MYHLNVLCLNVHLCTGLSVTVEIHHQHFGFSSAELEVVQLAPLIYRTRKVLPLSNRWFTRDMPTNIGLYPQGYVSNKPWVSCVYGTFMVHGNLCCTPNMLWSR